MRINIDFVVKVLEPIFSTQSLVFLICLVCRAMYQLQLQQSTPHVLTIVCKSPSEAYSMTFRVGANGLMCIIFS